MDNNKKLLEEKTKILEAAYTKKAKKNYIAFLILAIVGFVMIANGIINFVLFARKSGPSQNESMFAYIVLIVAIIGTGLFGTFLPLTIVNFSKKAKAKKMIRNGTLHEFCENKAYRIVYGQNKTKPVIIERKVKPAIAEKKIDSKKVIKVSKDNSGAVRSVCTISKVREVSGGLIKGSVCSIVASFFANKNEVKATFPSALKMLFTTHTTIYEEGKTIIKIIEKSILFGFLNKKPCAIIYENDKEVYSIYKRFILIRFLARHDTKFLRNEKLCYNISSPSYLATIFCNTETIIKDENKKIEKTITNSRSIFAFFCDYKSSIK